MLAGLTILSLALEQEMTRDFRSTRTYTAKQQAVALLVRGFTLTRQTKSCGYGDRQISVAMSRVMVINQV